jgi:hypothetical protein
MREGKRDDDVGACGPPCSAPEPHTYAAAHGGACTGLGGVELTPFSNLEKTAVLQEARIFHDLSLNARKCTALLTKILYLIYQGELLATSEATDVFFAITKLFQSKDVRVHTHTSAVAQGGKVTYASPGWVAGGAAAHGVPGDQGAGPFCGGRHHRHEQPAKGHDRQDRDGVPRQRHPRPRQDHRRTSRALVVDSTRSAYPSTHASASLPLSLSIFVYMRVCVCVGLLGGLSRR